MPSLPVPVAPVHQAPPAATLEHLEDRLINAEIHRRDCDHDFEVARDAWFKAVLAESLATDALKRARRGAPRG